MACITETTSYLIGETQRRNKWITPEMRTALVNYFVYRLFFKPTQSLTHSWTYEAMFILDIQPSSTPSKTIAFFRNVCIVRQVISIKNFCPVKWQNSQNLWRQKRQRSYNPIRWSYRCPASCFSAQSPRCRRNYHRITRGILPDKWSAWTISCQCLPFMSYIKALTSSPIESNMESFHE